MQISGDIDIDLGSRTQLLDIIPHVSASIRNTAGTKKHASGVYITPIPFDPVTNMSTLDYRAAEQRGYFKLDLLNVHLYEKIKDEKHLLSLMRDPDWSMLMDESVVTELVHLHKHFNTIKKCEPIDSIEKLAMLLALIRPSKYHLIGKSWEEIAKTIWDKDANGYSFKRSHSISYSHLVVVHMNLLKESKASYELM